MPTQHPDRGSCSTHSWSARAHVLRATAPALLSVALLACAQQAGPATTQAPPVPVAANAHAAASVSPEQAKRIVAELLERQYPAGFDKAHGCWKTTVGHGDDAMAYCMRPLAHHVVDEAGRTMLYVATASAADITDDPAYSYGATDAGMLDAFRLKIDGHGWSIASKSQGLDFGTSGDCGCADADFVQLGRDVHGWLFSSGGTWQGVTATSYAIVAPVGNAFKDVASIPQYVENDQDVEYRLAIVDDGPRAAWFPLRLMRYRKNVKVGEQVLTFDAAAQRYPVPDSLSRP